MFEPFLTKNTVTARQEIKPDAHKFYGGDLGVLLDNLGGISIGRGLYRVHTQESSVFWTQIIEKFLPDYKGRVVPFGYDWLGRHFTLDKWRKGYILIFDPATIEAYEHTCDLVTFHNHDLVEIKDRSVNQSFFEDILGVLNVPEIPYSACVGHKVPLFLGGQDEFSNFEVIDLEVHWEIQGQLFEQVKNLPPGTPINKVEFLKERKNNLVSLSD